MRNAFKSSIQERRSKKLGTRYQAKVETPDKTTSFDTSSSREEAQAFAAEMEAKWKAETSQLVPQQTIPSTVPAVDRGMDDERITEILKNFADTVECKERHKCLMGTLDKFVGNPTVGQLAPSWIKSYIARVSSVITNRGSPYALESIASQLSVIGVAIKWRAEELDIQPRAFVVKSKYFKDVARSQGKPMPKGKWQTQRTRRLEEGEEQRLEAEIAKIPGELGEQWAQFFRWTIATAARQKELVLAKWTDISAAGLSWNIPHYKTKARKMMITDEAKEILAEVRCSAKQGDEQIFPLLGSPAQVSKEFRRLAQSAGIEDFKFRDLRHEGISRLVVSQTMDMTRLMTMVGHSDPKMTEIYTHIREDELERLMVRKTKPGAGPAQPPARQPSVGEGSHDAGADRPASP